MLNSKTKRYSPRVVSVFSLLLYFIFNYTNSEHIVGILKVYYIQNIINNFKAFFLASIGLSALIFN